MKPVDLKSVLITDVFWKHTQELVRTQMIPYQWNALNDLIEGAAPSYCMHNFHAAKRQNQLRREQGADFSEPVYHPQAFQRLPEDPANPDALSFYGFVFQDTDLYKWLEAVAYSLASHPDEELESIADAAIETICAAQLESGYLDTFYILNGMNRAFTNLRSHHELYCFGHLAEAAVAYYESTGKDRLLDAACRFADYINSHFGEGKCMGYPGHEIAEMALVRLYEATGNESYRNLSQFFIDQRGTQPHYFVEEELENAQYEGKPSPAPIDPAKHAYAQAHEPVREQHEAVGHAVRAVYLYSGMADLARLTGDASLLNACRRLWQSIAREKLYVTGGIGGTHMGEAFSYPYDLPNDTAYSETCAAIGLVFFARRMLQLEPKSEYADVMERALYNTVLSGMSLDGKSFFYVNPLEVLPEACRLDECKKHVQPQRQKWFGCACCPPNLARLVESLSAYAYTQTEDTLWFHLYLGSELTTALGGKQLHITVQTQMPWDGKITVRVEAPEQTNATLAFRVPGWCNTKKMRIRTQQPIRQKDGYLYISGPWEETTEINLNFPMEPQLITADPRVRENIGKAAVQRGPLVYCAEEADNGSDLHCIRLDADRIAGIRTANILDGILALDVPAKRLFAQADALYIPYQKPQEENITLRMIPYYAWANRGEGEMSVWFRT